MRQLRSCDFCDAEAGLGVYEVGPEGVAGAESRRLVLCPDCRDRLDWVLEPFHAALGDDAGDSDDDVTLLGVSNPGPGTRERRGSSRGPSATDQPADGSDDSDADDSGASPDAPDDPIDAPDDGTDASGDAIDASSDAADENSPTARPGGASTAERAADDTPPKYRQVMRFLGNRDLPIDRTEAETLASGAYDLDAGEATKIIDTAVERGLLIEEDGQLRPA